jgi:beta-lactamase regulating signal transducer with metallopeptidase domain
MMLLWIAYAMLVGALAALGAFAVDRAARLVRIPTRWVWAAAIALAIGLSMRPPEVDLPYGVPTFGYESSDQAHHAPAATGDWFAAARWRLAENARRLDVARVLRLSSVSTIGRYADRYVIGAWIALSAMLALAFVIVHARLRLARSRWPRAELHGAPVRLSARVGPAAIGLLRPEIVVPAWLLARSNAEQRMAIAHESSHKRARDPQLLGAAWIALILFPWNPALWLMVSRLRLSIEVDCDRRVLRGGASPNAYGSLLVAVAELASPLRPSALALADDSSHLKTRILAMDAHLPKFGRIRAGLATLIGAIAVLAACEAKEPTAADVDAMTGATAEKAARQLGVLHAADTGVAYVVDSVRVSPETARRLGSGEILTMKVRRELNATPEVDFTTQHDIVRRSPPGDTDVMRGFARRAQGDTAIAWFLNGVRVDYASEIRRLDRNSIESVEVLKGPAAEAEYRTLPDQKVIAIRTKGGASK